MIHIDSTDTGQVEAERLSPELRTKYRRLVEVLSSMERVLIAYSGGMDSTLLLAASVKAVQDRALAVTIRSPFHSHREISTAEERARLIGAQHLTIDVDLLSDEVLCSNPPDRCYWCKKTLLGHLKEVAEKAGLDHMVEGSNLSDDNDYRPGARAIAELNVRSPLKEVGLSKDEIRTVLKAKGLPAWDDPPNSCLAARIPYGERLSHEKLARIAAAEDVLINMGFTLVRVRSHGNIARIELDEGDLSRAMESQNRVRISQELLRLGFHYVCLDLRGYRTGSLNEVLDESGTS